MLLNQMFSGIFDSSTQSVISPWNFLLCMGTALAIGLMLAVMYCYKNIYTKSFVTTLAILPAVVCVVIMMVNGNVGTGVAVAGTFSLVRFRSVPGTAKEIGAIFLAMGAGLATGMGYLAYAVLFAIVMGGISIIYVYFNLGADKNSNIQRTLRITIPEDLDYTNSLEDLFLQFTKEWELVNVKTINMGSLFRLTYQIILTDVDKEKDFIDALRCRNGNLEISSSRRENLIAEL